MPLQKQLLPLSYGGGLDTKTDASSVPLGKWLVLENCTFAKPNSLHKRNGYTTLAQRWPLGTALSLMPLYTSGGLKTAAVTGGAIQASTMLASRGNELLESDGTNLYSYDPANTSWASKGALPAATVASIASVGTKYSITQYDTAYHSSGLQCIVGRQQDPIAAFPSSEQDLVYAIIDTATGQQVTPPTTIDVGANVPKIPKVCALGNYFLIFWIDSLTVLYAQAVSISAPQTLVYSTRLAITSGATTSAMGGFRRYDVTVSNGVAYVAFGDNVSTLGILGITSASPYTLSYSALGITTGAAPQAVCVCGNPFNNDVVAGFTHSDTTARAVAYNSTLSSATLAATTIDTQAAGFRSITAISKSSAATSIQFFMGWGQGDVDACYIRQNTLGSVYNPGTASTIVRSLKLAGKPILYSGAAYLPTWLTGPGAAPTLQATWILIDSSGRAVAKAFAGSASGATALEGTYNILPETPAVSNGKFNPVVGNFVRTSTNTAGVFAYAQYAGSVLQLNMADTVNSYTKAQLGGLLLFSGGVAQVYDGSDRAVEQGFLYYPQIQSATNAAGGGLSAGTYQYVVIYEWQDAAGQLHRSAPSPAQSVTVNLNDKVTLVIPTLRLTSKAGVWLQIYRTIANGTTFFQISNVSGPTLPTLLNSTTTDTVSFVDTLTDASITTRPQPYTTGGVLQSAAPPPLNSVIVHRSRIFGIDPTTGQLAYTKQYIPGSTGQPIEFSGFLTMNVDNRGGNPTALASLDEKLIVFKSDRIFMVLGQGPDSTGANSDFTDAVLVSSDTGCAAPKSIVLVPDGIMFKSPKGFYLLDRSLRVSYIGAPVETYNSANVTSAQLLPGVNQVRFTLDSGAAVVYDYYMQQWSVFTNISATDATIWQSQYVYSTSAGLVNVETAGSFVDPGSVYIAMRAVSPWIQLAQVQGFQRIYKVLVLANFVSAHQLTVKLAYDFATSFAQTDNITVASDPAPYQQRIFCAKQKCEAFQVSVQDVSTGTNGESLVLSGLMIEAGIKRGAFKIPASKSYG